MTDLERLQQFVQDVYLTRFNRFIDDITDTDGEVEVQKTIRWANMFLDELEREADWNFVRENDEDLGTITSAGQVIDVDSEIRKLVEDDRRPLLFKQGDSIVSRFEVVNANQITRDGWVPADRVAKVGTSLVFSRPFKDYEIGAHVLADTIHQIPRLVLDPIDISLLDLVLNYNLLVLGVAKNATLPDIVQGGLAPSFVQKYNDELQKAVAENADSATADEVVRDDFGYLGGIY